MDDPRLHEQIGKYLDGAATEAELDEFAALLARQSNAADQFAAESRLDAQLAGHFGQTRRTVDLSAIFDRPGKLPAKSDSVERGAASPRRRFHWLAASGLLAAAAAAIVLLVVLGPWRGTDTPSADALHEVLDGTLLVDGRAVKQVASGSAVEVPPGAPAVVRLPDGSRVELAPATSAVLYGAAPGARQLVELVEGEGTFSVEKGQGEFQVETRLGRVTALGTQFSVQVSREPSSRNRKEKEPEEKRLTRMMTVAVVTGLVQVEFQGKTFLLAAGESRVFAEEGEGKRIPGTVRGLFDSAAPGKIFVRPGGDRGKEPPVGHALASDVKIAVDGRAATLADIPRGALVSLKRIEENGPVVGVVAEGPSVGGEVRATSTADDGPTITLVGGESGDRGYRVARDVAVLIDGEPASFDEIRAGARVAMKLSVDKTTVVAIVIGKKKGGEGK